MSVEALTVTGGATRVEQDGEFAPWAHLVIARHPYLDRFVAAPNPVWARTY